MKVFPCAAVVLALFLAAPVAAQGVSAGCQSAMRSGWPVASKAMEDKDWKAAIAALAPLEIACASDPQALWLLDTVHAEGELRLGDSPAALARLDGINVPPYASIYATNRWVYLSASEATGDQARFNAARDGFVNAHAQAMIARPGVRRVESFETPAATVIAFQGDIQNGPFIRKIVFVAVPKAGGWPATLTVTDDRMSAALLGGNANKPVLMIDVYDCRGQALLKAHDLMRGGKLDYQAAKAVAVETFSDAKAFEAFGVEKPPHFCGFETYLMPGFASSDGGGS